MQFRLISSVNSLIWNVLVLIQRRPTLWMWVKLVQKNTRPLEWAGIESPKIRTPHMNRLVHSIKVT